MSNLSFQQFYIINRKYKILGTSASNVVVATPETRLDKDLDVIDLSEHASWRTEWRQNHGNYPEWRREIDEFRRFPLNVRAIIAKIKLPKKYS